jgi:hypothetical protein
MWYCYVKFDQKHYIAFFDTFDFCLESIAKTVFHGFTSSTRKKSLNVDYFIGQLHGRDDIQHVGRLANPLFFQ